VSHATPGTKDRGLLRHPDFLKLWSAETISQFGTQVSLLALPIIAAITLEVEPFEFALLGTIEFLPFILLSLPAGVWVDRLRRRPILIAADIGRAVALASIPVAFLFDALTIGQLYVVGFVNGCLTVFFDVAYQSYLPALVDRDQLVEGNSKLEMSRSAAQITGPGLSGLLVGVITAPAAIVLDSISFLASAAFLVRIRRPEPTPKRAVDASGKHASMRTEVAEGLRYVLTHRYLRAIAATTGTWNLFGNIATAIVVLYLIRELGFTPETLGITFSLGAIGYIVGAFSANRLAKRFGVGPTIWGSTFIGGPALLILYLAPRELAVPIAAGAFALTSWTGAVYNINQVSFRQAVTPGRMQGRMNATMRFIVWGTIPIGTIVGGFLAEMIGLRSTILVGAIGSLFAFLPVLLSPVRSLQRMPEPVDDDGSPLGEALDETPRPVVGSPRASVEEQQP
jgi:MFS family permease